MSETANPVAEGGIPEPKAATYPELKAGLIGADAAFICQCLDKAMTTAQASAAWMAEQNARIAAAEEKAKTPAKAEGVEPLTGASKPAESATDPIAAWSDAVDAKVKAGLARPKAIAAVARENAELHAAYIAAYNAQHGQSGR